MTTPKLEAAQQRLVRLLEQKKALEAKISREQGMLRERERKARTRRLIEYGGLVAIAGLDEEDKGTVLGLLLEGARRLPVDAKTSRRWKDLGDKELAARAAHAAAHTPGGTQNGVGTPATEERPSADMGSTEREGPGDVSSAPVGEGEGE
jgi:Conjugal transfer protein TraD